MEVLGSPAWGTTWVVASGVVGDGTASGGAWLQRIRLGHGKDLGGLEGMNAGAHLGRGCVIQDGRVLAILSSDIVSSRDFWCPLGEDIGRDLGGLEGQNQSQERAAKHEIRCVRGPGRRPLAGM